MSGGEEGGGQAGGLLSLFSLFTFILILWRRDDACFVYISIKRVAFLYSASCLATVVSCFQRILYSTYSFSVIGPYTLESSRLTGTDALNRSPGGVVSEQFSIRPFGATKT